MTKNKTWAWQLACKLFLWNTPVRESSLDAHDTPGLALLRERRVVETCRNDFEVMTCPYCGQEDGDVVQGEQGLVCQCPECGEVILREEDRVSWRIKPGWLATAIRHAMELSGSPVDLKKSVVRLGVYDRRPVALSPRLTTVALDGQLMDRIRIKKHGDPIVVAPKVGSPQTLPGGLDWLPLEERFALYGDGLTFIAPGNAGTESTASTPVYGPFSQDFRTVFLEDEMIALSAGQAALFKALWDFGGSPQNKETILNKANLSSDKLIDLFKIKTKNKGNPKYELQKMAYDRLISCKSREGLYWMDCAIGSTSNFK